MEDDFIMWRSCHGEIGALLRNSLRRDKVPTLPFIKAFCGHERKEVRLYLPTKRLSVNGLLDTLLNDVFRRAVQAVGDYKKHSQKIFFQEVINFT